MGKIDIAYIADENFAMPTCVSMISLISNKKESTEVNIYVLLNKVSDDKKSAIRMQDSHNVNVNIIEVSLGIYNDLAQDCISKGIHVSPIALVKFDLCNILSCVDKLLYLDGDVIVQGDLVELYETELGEDYIAAVDDMGDKVENGKSQHASRIDIKGAHYFNSGVMLLNLKKMREDDIDKKLLYYRMTNKNYFMDQDAFNYVMGNYRKLLPFKYNFRCPILEEMDFEECNSKFFESYYIDEEECIKRQTILHLTDRRKPWEYRICYFSDLFKRYYKLSPFSDVKLLLKSPMLEQKNLYDNIIESQRCREESQRCREGKMEWHFPKERVPSNSRIVIYGAGDMGRSFVLQMAATHYAHVIMWVDKNHERMGSAVHAPEKILECKFDYILVAILDSEIQKNIKNFLIKMKILEKKIVTV